MPGQSPGDAELEEALGSIDGEILAERAVIESRSNENPNNPGVPAGGGAGGQGSQNDGQASSPVLAPTNRTAPPPPQPGRSNSDVVPDDLLRQPCRKLIQSFVKSSGKSTDDIKGPDPESVSAGLEQGYVWA
jgi:hypothetical protein